MPVSWPELALGMVFLLLVANAARRGFLREGSLLLGLGLALWGAGRLYRQVAAAILRDGEAPWSIALYGALVLMLLIVASGLSALITPLVQRGPLRVIDRLAGLAVGAGEATLLVGLLAAAGERVGVLRLPPASPAWRAAELAGRGLSWLTAAIPHDLLGLVR